MGIDGHPSLILVGTVHGDPRGYSRLTRFLGQENPAAISVEISSYSRAFRAKKGAIFRALLRENLQKVQSEDGQPYQEIMAHSAVQGIFSFLKEPFECKASAAYARKYGRPLEEVDLSSYSQEKLGHMEDLVSVENVRTLLRMPFPKAEDQIERDYKRAGRLWEHPPSFWSQGQEIEEREIFMAQKIRRIVHLAGDQKVIHIGGWEHLLGFTRGKSLWGLLQDLEPKRILLSAVGN